LNSLEERLESFLRVHAPRHHACYLLRSVHQRYCARWRSCLHLSHSSFLRWTIVNSTRVGGTPILISLKPRVLTYCNVLEEVVIPLSISSSFKSIPHKHECVFQRPVSILISFCLAGDHVTTQAGKMSISSSTRQGTSTTMAQTGAQFPSRTLPSGRVSDTLGTASPLRKVFRTFTLCSSIQLSSTQVTPMIRALPPVLF